MCPLLGSYGPTRSSNFPGQHQKAISPEPAVMDSASELFLLSAWNPHPHPIPQQPPPPLPAPSHLSQQPCTHAAGLSSLQSRRTLSLLSEGWRRGRTLG